MLFGPSNLQGALPLELAIENFTSGTPAVKWAAAKVPINICTHDANRPAHISRDLYIGAVVDAVTMWNNVEAAVGIRYTGDCMHANTWADDNGINEIGWDDHRNDVKPPAAAVTKGTWFIFPGRREFTETDIVIDNLLTVPEQCFRSIVAHELGHALGFGHSDVPGQLMFPSFNSSNIATCPTSVSAEEAAFLVTLYGQNRRPTITVPAEVQGAPGTLIQLSVTASDPEGDPLTYTWKQVGGPAVALASNGPTATFTAPAQSGAALTFEVTVADRFLKTATATVAASVGGTTVPITLAPSFETFLPNAAKTAASIGWQPVAGATQYELCARIIAGAVTCSTQASSKVDVTWKTVLGAAGTATERRVLDGGARELTLAACNAGGCGMPGQGPHAGGLRWSVWDMDYDFFAMAFDIPGSSFKFTIAGVTNVSSTPRRFTLYSGTPADPTQKVIQSCGTVAAGGACVWYLGPNDAGHASHVVVVSERVGSPTVENRIKVR